MLWLAATFAGNNRVDILGLMEAWYLWVLQCHYTTVHWQLSAKTLASTTSTHASVTASKQLAG